MCVGLGTLLIAG